MSADIIGTKGANFTFTLSAATITNATTLVGGKPGPSLPFSNREVTVKNLAPGETLIQLTLVWAPGDPDAAINVGTVTSGTVNAASPRHTLDAGKTPGTVELSGT